jgi:hypothetical protein
LRGKPINPAVAVSQIRSQISIKKTPLKNMRSHHVIILLILACGFYFFKKKDQNKDFQADSSAIFNLGTYTMNPPPIGSPCLSYKFIDDRNVQMLGDNKPWGQNNGMCTYVIKNNIIELTHACGVKNLPFNSDSLYDEKLHSVFKLVKNP